MSSSLESSSPSRSLGRAALLGLAAGMLMGGAWLLFLGVRGLLTSPDCLGLSKNECTLLTEATLHIGRVQTISGGALLALGLSLCVLLRPYLSPRPAKPPKP